MHDCDGALETISGRYPVRLTNGSQTVGVSLAVTEIVSEAGTLVG